MITLISFYNLPFWSVLLSWVLLFLLGLLLGWVLWSKFQRMYDALKAEYDEFKLKFINMKDDLSKCKSNSNEFVSDISLLRGRIRECEAELKNSTKVRSNDALSVVAGIVAENVSEDSKSGIAASKFAALKEDNLQVVEGVGPKMNKFLVKYGIVTWVDLASKSSGDIQKLLDEEGNKYRIIDPSTWQKQATMARDGKWEELIVFQKKLDAGRKKQSAKETDSKVEKLLVKLGMLKKWKKDDLKAIEGIGPKIASLLQADGIKTWESLAEIKVSKIQKILDNAGKRYALADPGTWPKQAKLAARGKWEKLDKYQEFLKGGKE